MWIRRIEVADCGGIASACMDLAPGLNVLHGPNELGKSTLVQAVRAAFLFQPSVAAAESLRDWHSAAPASVSLTFEQEGDCIWRIRKTFGPGGRAYLDFSKDGRDFTAEGRGREVDGKLQDILRWGIDAPGGRRGRRGAPSSLITTALLGQQSEVVAILQRSLNDDSNGTGRERLTEALQALAEDPRFKRVVDAVQAQVDEAFTATGRKRTGRGSPWANLREQRENAAARERDIGKQVAESSAIRTSVGELTTRLLDARAESERLSAALGGLRRHRTAEGELAVAAGELDRVQSALRDLARNEKAVDAATSRLAETEAERTALGKVVSDMAAEVKVAEERLRELRSGAGEQERLLREQKAENRRLGLQQEQAEHAGRVVQAKGLAALEEQVRAGAGEVERRSANVAEKRELLAQASDATTADRERLDDLDLDRRVVRLRASQKAADAAVQERDSARDLAETARALDEQAARLRAEAEALHAPDDAEIERLRVAERNWQVADAKRSVGFVAELALAAGGNADVTVDGKAQMQALEAGQAVAIEAATELRIEIADLASVRVRGGGRDLLEAAERAENLWHTASDPIFARTGCADIEELHELRKRADVLLGDADQQTHQAEAARLQPERLHQLEQQVLTAQAALQACREAIAELIDEDETVDDAVASIAALGDAGDEGTIGKAIDKLRERVRERELLSTRLAAEIEDDDRELKRLGEECAANEARLAESEQAFDWRALLADADAENQRLSGELGAVVSELGAIRSEAVAGVDAASRAHDELQARLTAEQRALDKKKDDVGNARTDLARLEGQTGPLRDRAQGLDAEAALAAKEAAAEALAALPPVDDSVDQQAPDEQALERVAEKAAEQVRLLETERSKAEGALEQGGGQFLDEQRAQAEEAIKALDGRERELELDYGAWRLLRETLRDAEKADVAHLGSALVGPVSRRISALTDGRYGDIAIGPQLDASGIELGGAERPFDALSVGTQEQIALVLRLAIAEALDTFVILDDQLTQADPERMASTSALLAEAARRVQVVVLTCHPADYRIDGGHIIDLTEHLSRSEPTAAPSAPSPPAQPAAQSQTGAVRRRRRAQEPAPEDEADNLMAALRNTMDRRDAE